MPSLVSRASTNLDRLVAILDQPKMYGVRRQFLRIEPPTVDQLNATERLIGFRLGASVGSRTGLVPTADSGSIDAGLEQFEEMLRTLDLTGSKTLLLLRLIGQVRDGELDAESSEANAAVAQVFLALVEHVEQEIKAALDEQSRAWFSIGQILYEVAWGRALAAEGGAEYVLGARADGVRFQRIDPSSLERPRVVALRAILAQTSPPEPIALEIEEWVARLRDTVGWQVIWAKTNQVAQTIDTFLLSK
jgi:hypothetical protein